MDIKDLKFDIRDWNSWIKNRHTNKDLITIKELLDDYENLIMENEELEDKIKELEKDIEDNYKPLPKYY